MLVLSKSASQMVSGGNPLPVAGPVISWLGYNGYDHFNTIAIATLVERSLHCYMYYNGSINANSPLSGIGMAVISFEIQYQIGVLMKSASSYWSSEE